MIQASPQHKHHRLGELLLGRRWITGAQLRQAMETQGLRGGRLGSCLLEVGAISEDRLLEVLAQQLGVPAASADELRDVAQDVRSLIPAKLARRCQAVPFRVLGGEVHIAMLDVHNLSFQDELSFAAGKRARPHIGNEARIFEALERYYGHECPARFTLLLDQLNRMRYLWRHEGETEGGGKGNGGNRNATAPAAAWSLPETPALPSPSQWLSQFPLDPSPSSAAPRPAARKAGEETGEKAAPAPARPPRGEVGKATPGAAEPTEIARPEAATPEPESPEPADERAAPRASAPAPRRSPRQPRVITLTPEERALLGSEAGGSAAVAMDYDQAVKLLAEAEDRDEVGSVLMGHLTTLFDRVALLVARRDGVQGWMGSGPGLSRNQLADLFLGFDQPSMFLNLSRGGAFFLGPPAPMPAHRELIRCWDGQLPPECLALPLRLRDRLVMVAYADRGTEPLGRLDLERLQALAREAEKAFEACILRKKKTRSNGSSPGDPP